MLHLLVPCNTRDLRRWACSCCCWTLQDTAETQCTDKLRLTQAEHARAVCKLLNKTRCTPGTTALRECRPWRTANRAVHAAVAAATADSPFNRSNTPSLGRVQRTLRAGYREGCAGFATSQMHSSPSAAPEASRLGLKLLNSRPLTCKETGVTQTTLSVYIRWRRQLQLPGCPS